MEPLEQFNARKGGTEIITFYDCSVPVEKSLYDGGKKLSPAIFYSNPPLI